MPCPRMRQSRRRYRLEPMRGDPEPVSPVYAGPAGPSAEFVSRFQRRTMPPSCGPDLIPSTAKACGRGIKPVARHLQSWTGLGQGVAALALHPEEPGEPLTSVLTRTANPPF